MPCYYPVLSGSREKPRARGTRSPRSLSPLYTYICYYLQYFIVGIGGYALFMPWERHGIVKPESGKRESQAEPSRDERTARPEPLIADATDSCTMYTCACVCVCVSRETDRTKPKRNLYLRPCVNYNVGHCNRVGSAFRNESRSSPARQLASSFAI